MDQDEGYEPWTHKHLDPHGASGEEEGHRFVAVNWRVKITKMYFIYRCILVSEN